MGCNFLSFAFCLAFSVKEKTRSLISTQPYASESNSVYMKMRKFYQSCMALDYIEADQEKPLKKNIQKLGKQWIEYATSQNFHNEDRRHSISPLRIFICVVPCPLSGGWKVLRTFRQTEFDFTRVLKKLQAEHRTSPFFEVQVVPDPRIPERNIIKVETVVIRFQSE